MILVIKGVFMFYGVNIWLTHLLLLPAFKAENIYEMALGIDH